MTVQWTIFKGVWGVHLGLKNLVVYSSCCENRDKVRSSSVKSVNTRKIPICSPELGTFIFGEKQVGGLNKQRAAEDVCAIFSHGGPQGAASIQVQGSEENNSLSRGNSELKAKGQNTTRFSSVLGLFSLFWNKWLWKSNLDEFNILFFS